MVNDYGIILAEGPYHFGMGFSRTHLPFFEAVSVSGRALKMEVKLPKGQVPQGPEDHKFRCRCRSFMKKDGSINHGECVPISESERELSVLRWVAYRTRVFNLEEADWDQLLVSLGIHPKVGSWAEISGFISFLHRQMDVNPKGMRALRKKVDFAEALVNIANRMPANLRRKIKRMPFMGGPQKVDDLVEKAKRLLEQEEVVKKALRRESALLKKKFEDLDRRMSEQRLFFAAEMGSIVADLERRRIDQGGPKCSSKSE